MADFEKLVGKKMKNKITGEVAYVNSYADKPSVLLSNGVGFCVDSPRSQQWEIYGGKKKSLSDKEFHSTLTDTRAYYSKDVKQSVKEYISWVDSNMTYPKVNDAINNREAAKKIFGSRLME